MNRVALVYQCPINEYAVFASDAKRWAATRLQYDPGFPCDNHIVFTNGDAGSEHRKVFGGIQFKEHLFVGGGWDIGANQWVSGKLKEYDLAVFMNARGYFNRAGWLARLMEARDSEFDANGLYGISTSCEPSPIPNPYVIGPNPHVRTGCFATRPSALNRYPYLINSRAKSFMFESGPWNVSQWYEDMGYKVLMVTWDGVYWKCDWRKPDNIFRRGDQSNLLVRDRHTAMFDSASDQERAILSSRADGGMPYASLRMTKWDDTNKSKDSDDQERKAFTANADGLDYGARI